MDPAKRIPLARLTSREDCLSAFPGLPPEGLTGGITIFDGQMYSPSRLAISFLRSAAEAGASVANYLEATGFLQTKSGHVHGITAKDLLSGDVLSIHGKVLLNAAGPWAERLLRSTLNIDLHPKGTYSRDAYFVIPRRLGAKCALAVQGMTKDPDAILSRQQRHLFIVPWRRYTLIGVWHMVSNEAPDACVVTEKDLRGFIDEVNHAYPAIAVKRDEVLMWNSGLVLFGENKPGAVHLSYGKRSRIVDHARDHGIKGLITLVGVRYTTARREARRAVDLVVKKIGKETRSAAPITPIFGGEIASFEDFMRQGLERRPPGLDRESARALLHNYGSRYGDVLQYLDENPRWVETVGTTTVTKAEVVHAIRREMAEKLEDVVFRRTELGTAGYPGRDALIASAELMAAELGWDHSRKHHEVQELERYFSLHGRQNRQSEAGASIAVP